MRAREVIFSPRRISHPFLSEPEAAEEFSAVILDFSAGELARASGRSKDTAKCWKVGRAFPNGVSLIALIREFKPIRTWVESKVGALDSPRGMSEGFAILEKIMVSNTPEGRAMRARALELASGKGTP